MLKHFQHLILLTFAVAVPLFAVSQADEEIANTLENQFLELKKKSNNYQQFKVVDKIRLNNYWASVNDTLIETRSQINSLEKEVGNLSKSVNELKNELSEKEDSLQSQSYQIEHMSFLGLDMTKGSYITFSWILIFTLMAIVMILFMRFNAAHRVTKSTQAEFSQLNHEFEDHKKKTRDKETKLKRELQTEINRVEELKLKLGEA